MSSKIKKKRLPLCSLTKIIHFCILCAFSAYRHAEMSKRNLLQLFKKRQDEIKEHDEKR